MLQLGVRGRAAAADDADAGVLVEGDDRAARYQRVEQGFLGRRSRAADARIDERLRHRVLRRAAAVLFEDGLPLALVTEGDRLAADRVEHRAAREADRLGREGALIIETDLGAADGEVAVGAADRRLVLA